MKSLNKVQLIGNIGKDLLPKFTPSGKKVVSFSMAMNSTFTNAAGVKVDQTEWMNAEIWDMGAELLSQYAKKGSKVYVEGRLKTDMVPATDTSPAKYFTKVVVREFMLLDKREVAGQTFEAPDASDEVYPDDGIAAPVAAPIPFS